MTLDLDAIAPAAKLELILSGEDFGSDDTHDQATQTLQGFEAHGKTLLSYGISADDQTDLGEARDQLSAAGFGRTKAKANKKSAGSAVTTALSGARTTRLRGRTMLSTVRSKLLQQGQTQGAQAAEAVLGKTVDSKAVGEDLAVQLDLMADALDPAKAPLAAAACAKSGGPATLTALTGAAKTLREARKAKPSLRGTPMETQKLDLLDGIIIDICRRARDAAEVAAKELGDPAILKAFKLDKLYAARVKKSADGTKKAPEGGTAAKAPKAPKTKAEAAAAPKVEVVPAKVEEAPAKVEEAAAAPAPAPAKEEAAAAAATSGGEKQGETTGAVGAAAAAEGGGK